jgi:hypothetical protein
MSSEETDELRRALLTLLPALAVPAMLPTTAAAQDAARIQSGNYRVAFENDKVRVLDFVSRPGMGVCGRGMHSHPAHLTLTLTPGRARVKLPDGTVRAPTDMPAGTVFWSEAETHDVENVSGRDMRAMLIELKA